MVTRILAPWYFLDQDQVRFRSSSDPRLVRLTPPDLKGFPATNFDSQKRDGSGPKNLRVNVRSSEHTALAREIASASAVLLKNTRSTTTGTPSGITTRGLPVAKERIKSIAVVGQDAKMPNLNCSEMNECNDGTMSVGYAFHVSLSRLGANDSLDGALAQIFWITSFLPLMRSGLLLETLPLSLRLFQTILTRVQPLREARTLLMYLSTRAFCGGSSCYPIID